jgi:hypothetical protein
MSNHWGLTMRYLSQIVPVLPLYIKYLGLFMKFLKLIYKNFKVIG